MTARPSPSPATKPGELPSSPLIHWFRPEEPVEMVMSGACGDAIAKLLNELRRVEDFVRVRIDAPSRVLFSGPSGTGKTLAARWIARELGVPIAVADVSSMISKYVGESSEQLRQCFEIVKGVRGAVLFLDEVDAICMKRENAKTASGAELARVTTTFFQQIDWLPAERIVLAATNFANDLDPALRRRFTTHVVFEPPPREGRLTMLRGWLKATMISDEELEQLADETEGLAGADLRSRAMAVGRARVMALPPGTLQGPPQRALFTSPRRSLKDDDRAPDGVERGQNIISMLERLDQ